MKMYNKVRLLICGFFVFAAVGLFAAVSTPKGFMDNFDKALELAKKENKALFVVFSGSDWCGWCVKLEKEILSKPEFVPAVSKFLIPVYIDNPRNKELLTEWGKENNRKLTTKYKVRGFPTALVMDKNGNVIGKTGYDKGGVEKYVENLKSMTQNTEEKTRWVKPIESKVSTFLDSFREDLNRIYGEEFKAVGKNVKRSERSKLMEKVYKRFASEIFPNAKIKIAQLEKEIAKLQNSAPDCVKGEFSKLNKELSSCKGFMKQLENNIK